MELGNLTRKIISDMASAKIIKGTILYTGKESDRGTGDRLTFSYKFPQGEASGFRLYDHGDRDLNEAEQNKMETAKNILAYYLKEDIFQIDFIEKSENDAKIELYRKSEKDSSPLKESKGRREWLKFGEKLQDH